MRQGWVGAPQQGSLGSAGSFYRQRFTPPNRNILDDLGVINTSVFLSNCTIWVEGITDRLLFRHYLKRYLESHGVCHTIMEGKHYSFVEYGCSNITYWSFLDEEDSPINIDQLSGRALVITDDDNPKAGSKKEERHETLERKPGDRFIKLPC